MNELENLRDQIDDLDSQLVDLLAKRFKVTDQVGHYKAKHGLSSRDYAREDAQAAKLAEQAKAAGINPGLVQDLLLRIIDEVVRGHDAKRAQRKTRG